MPDIPPSNEQKVKEITPTKIQYEIINGEIFITLSLTKCFGQL